MEDLKLSVIHDGFPEGTAKLRKLMQLICSVCSSIVGSYFFYTVDLYFGDSDQNPFKCIARQDFLKGY